MGSNVVFYPNNTQDLVGQRFGRLLAVERIVRGVKTIWAR